MRKNKIEGAIPGAGRKVKDKTKDANLNVRISKDAKTAMESIPRMQRGSLIDKLILEYFMI